MSLLVAGTSLAFAVIGGSSDTSPRKPVARDSRPVYADCRVTDAWQADAAAPRTDALTTWLKVRYPEPGDKGDHWVYGGYTFPFGHNGNIPECPAD